MQVRNWSFDIKSILPLEKPVISVGNMTMGGTGKTPFVEYVIQWCLENKLKVGVVSRGYKGTYSGVEKVDSLKSKASLIYGDEPILLARKFPQIPIYVCRKRKAAAEKLLQENYVDLIIADDAFQHRALPRDLDIVLVDATEPLNNYRVFPEGRSREPFKNFKRADFIIVNKKSGIDKSELDLLITHLGGVSKAMILFGDYAFSKIVELESEKSYDIEQFRKELGEESLALISGIGNPDYFQKQVEDSGFCVKKHFKFPDHSQYSMKNLEEIIKFSKLNPDIKFLITEKDFVKWPKELNKNFYFVKLKFNLEGEVRAFEKALLDLVS